MLEIRNVSKTYRPKKGVPVKALDDVSLKFQETGMVFILGKSGSGKSTLLNVLGGLDAADTGEFIIKGKSSKDFSQADFDSYRNTFIGFIFQEYNILPEFTVGANIALAMELQGKKATDEELSAILDEVDLTGYGSRKPNELSGGQKQRVAIARALVKSPEIIMADEPTGAIDSKTGKQVFDTLKKLSRTKLVLIVSHDRDFAEQYADRIIELKDGKILSDVSKTQIQPTSVSEGVSVIDGGMLHIKKGYSLTPEDLALINEYIAKADNDTFISTDAKSNSDLKKAAGIGDDGAKDAFKDTDGKDIKLKEYSPEDSKFIRSRLPYKNSLKIGASSLKSKPVRLVFTIFLCLVAFTLFGISDTASTYDRPTVLLQSINDSQVSFASFSKTYRSHNENYTSETDLNLTDDDLLKIESETGLDVIPVYGGTDSWNRGFTFSNLLVDSTKLNSSSGTNFYMSKYSGYAEITQETLDRAGFSLTGALPSADDEIAITKYIYDHFDYAGLSYYDTATRQNVSLNPDDINSFEDVIGKTVILNSNSSYPNVNERKVKIVGIIDTGLTVAEKYQSYLPSSGENQASSSEQTIVDMINREELNASLLYSYDALVAVNEGMLSRIVSAGKVLNGLSDVAFGKVNNNIYFNLSNNLSGWSFNHVATLSQAKNYVDITWLDGEKTSLENGEVIVAREPDHETHGSARIKASTIEALENAGYIFEEYEKEQLREISIFDLSYSGKPTNVYLSKLTINDVPESFKNYVDSQHKAQMDPNMDSSEFSTTDEEYLNLYREYLFNEGDKENAYGGKAGASYYNEFLKIVYEAENVTSPVPSTGSMKAYGPISVELDTDQYTIVGYYMPNENYTNVGHYLPCIVSDYVYGALKEPESGDYSFAVGVMPLGNNQAIEKIISFSETETDDNMVYPLNNGATYILNSVDSFIVPLAQGFFYVGIFFAVFAALMMFNFISVSINYKKREIGILRAVGAKSSDVFGIFFNESLIITLINFLLSSAATFTLVKLLNNFLRTEYGLVITILNIGIRQFLLILGLGILVAFVGSFLPVMRIARKKPIDAIQNR